MKEKILTRDFPLEIKEVAEEGTFEGYLSVYDVVDEVNDIVEKGAFAKTIKENKGVIPMLWQHDHRQPIGTLELEEDEVGLKVKGIFTLGVQQAKEAYELVKAAVIRGMSIGYRATKKQMKNGVRHLEEIKLFEGSIVTFPALPIALITDVKEDEKADDFNTILEEMLLRSKRYQMFNALGWTLDDIVWDYDLTSEEKIAAIDESIQQFHEAYLELLPKLFGVMNKSASVDTGSAHPLSGKDRKAIEGAISHLKFLLDNEAADTAGIAADTSEEAASTKDAAADTSEIKEKDIISSFNARMKKKLVV